MSRVLEIFSDTDCTNILNKKLKTRDYKIKSFEFCQPNEFDGFGFMADYFLLNIKYEVNEEVKNLQLFVKGIRSIKCQRDYVIESGAYAKESCMYQDIIPEFERYNINIINDCIPKCYLVLDGTNFFFENIKLQDYKCLNHRDSMELEATKICLEILAKFHCSSLIYEEKSGTKISEKFPEVLKETFYKTNTAYDMLEPGTKGTITQINLFEKNSQIDIESFKQFACETYKKFPQFVQSSDIYRNVICHGDLWPTNIMFQFEGIKPSHCYIIDFQSYRYGPPAQDFMTFLYFSTDREFRDNYMEELTIYYHEKMTEILKRYDIAISGILSLNEFRRSCNFYKLFAIAQAAIVYPHIMLPPDEVKSVMNTPQTLLNMVFEDCSDVILKMCKNDDVYERRLRETMTEFKELFIEKYLI